uniref:Prefoldin subunit 4 n=1 Tax=Tabanus bromius TaxID=304241 RepID=A0A0K8TP25_TABBR
MAAKGCNSGKAFQPDSDVHITYEDQQKINKFAKHNARLEDFKSELEARKNDLKNLDDAFEEIELFDEDEIIPCLIGEVFVCNSLDETQILLKNEKRKIEHEIKDIELKCQDIQQIMSDLKAQLYQRFGSNISLENDE